MFGSVKAASRFVAITEELLHSETVDWLRTVATFECAQRRLVDEVFLSHVHAGTVVGNVL